MGKAVWAQKETTTPRRILEPAPSPVQTPKQKAKVQCCWLISGSSLQASHWHTSAPLWSTQQDHSHPYSSFTCLSKLCQKRHGFCQILSAQKAPPRHFPGDLEQPHRALDTFTLPVEASNLYIMQPAEPNNGDNLSTALWPTSFRKSAMYIPTNRSLCFKLRLQVECRT